MAQVVFPEYLPRSATFISTAIRAQPYDAVVIADGITNLSEFPVERIVALEVDAFVSGGLTARLTARRARTGRRCDSALTRVLQEHDCSLAHAHFGWSGAASARACDRLGIPLVTTFYGRDTILKSGRFSRRGLYDRLFSTAARLLVEGPVFAERLAGLGCPEERIEVVRIGIELDRFPFAPRSRGDGPLTFLQAARFVDKKGFDTTLRAFALARRALPDARLWLVGDGPLRAQLAALARDLDLADRVRFFGMVDHDEYRRIAEAAHICVQPSRTAPDGDTEGGAPTVLLEMQASGAPVLATRHADIPSVVADPAALVAENDHEGLAAEMIRLGQMSDGEWLEVAAAGRALVEREHDSALIGRRLGAIYRSVFGAS